MTNTQRIDQRAQVIRTLSVSTLRDMVLDNPSLFPECDGMSEMELIKVIAREHAHNRAMMAQEQTPTVPMSIFAFPAFLMAGMVVTGILMVMGY